MSRCGYGTMRAMKSIVILISGRGSNMEAIVRASQAEQWPARNAAVISNRAEAADLLFAAEQGIPTVVVQNKDYPTRKTNKNAQQEANERNTPEQEKQAGFLR